MLAKRLMIFAAAAMLSQATLADRQGPVEVDTALILAVDISDSVDASRYRLQMEGIARSLEDPAVISTITSGPQGAILLALVEWSDTAVLTMPWQLIQTREDALKTAGIVRSLEQKAGEYTCVSRMMTFVSERIVSAIPARPSRIVLDVSGDGIDNCREPADTAAARDGLVNDGVQINGLPIIVAGENETVGAGAYRAPGFGLGSLHIGPGTHQTTLDAWYMDYVIGGPAGFLIRANGFEDFERAFKQKFVSEISMAPRATSPTFQRGFIEVDHDDRLVACLDRRPLVGEQRPPTYGHHIVKPTAQPNSANSASFPASVRHCVQ